MPDRAHPRCRPRRRARPVSHTATRRPAEISTATPATSKGWIRKPALASSVAIVVVPAFSIVHHAHHRGATGDVLGVSVSRISAGSRSKARSSGRANSAVSVDATARAQRHHRHQREHQHRNRATTEILKASPARLDHVEDAPWRRHLHWGGAGSRRAAPSACRQAAAEADNRSPRPRQAADHRQHQRWPEGEPHRGHQEGGRWPAPSPSPSPAWRRGDGRRRRGLPSWSAWPPVRRSSPG